MDKQTRKLLQQAYITNQACGNALAKALEQPDENPDSKKPTRKEVLKEQLRVNSKFFKQRQRI